MARFVVMYDTPSDIEAFERHYREVHIPLAKQLPGLRRYTVSHDATPVIGEPYHLVAMLDWDDWNRWARRSTPTENKTAEDAITNFPIHHDSRHDLQYASDHPSPPRRRRRQRPTRRPA